MIFIIYINDFFEQDTTYIGSVVCKNFINTALDLKNQTYYPLISKVEEIKNQDNKFMLKGKNSNDYQVLAESETDINLKKIYMYLSFALKRLEKEKNHSKSHILNDINKTLIEKDKYIDSLYPNHKHNI